MVWKYVCPVVRDGPLAQGEKAGSDHRGHEWNAVFKIHRYEPDYPGLAGRDLTPKGPVELPAAKAGQSRSEGNWGVKVLLIRIQQRAVQRRQHGRPAQLKPVRPEPVGPLEAPHRNGAQLHVRILTWINGASASVTAFSGASRC